MTQKYASLVKPMLGAWAKFADILEATGYLRTRGRLRFEVCPSEITTVYIGAYIPHLTVQVLRALDSQGDDVFSCVFSLVQHGRLRFGPLGLQSTSTLGSACERLGLPDRGEALPVKVYPQLRIDPEPLEFIAWKKHVRLE